jgi:N-methylhydantoinase A
MAALEVTATEAGVPLTRLLADTEHFALGTTAVTNCLAQRSGAATGLLVTRGFGDLWPMARGHRRGIDGMSYPFPVLVPRRRVGEVTERIDRDGRILLPLDERDAVAAVDRLVVEEGVESLAVCFLWSCRNAAHERRVRELIAVRQPSLHVSCSADLFPELREYERMTAAVLNAYTWPSFSAFLDAVAARLAAAGLRAPLAIMQSNGGTCSPEEARGRPIVLAQSGPVAGVSAAQALGRAMALPDVITGDMATPSAASAPRSSACRVRWRWSRSARSGRGAEALPGATRAICSRWGRGAWVPTRGPPATGEEATSRR